MYLCMYQCICIHFIYSSCLLYCILSLDEVVCAIPRVECVDVSWTRSLERQYYWDDKHFKAPVYNKIVDQIAAQINKVR